MSLPTLQVGKPRPESSPVCPRVGHECKRAFQSLQAWLGWSPPSGQCPALRLWLWAWHHAQPSPQQLQASLSPGLLRKPFTSFDSPLINVPSICHLRPPLPTLSRGLPRTAPKSSIAYLLRLPPGHSSPSPGLSPFPSSGREQSKPRIDQERKENHKLLGPAEGVYWESPAGFGVTPDYATLCPGPGGLAVLWLLVSTDL